ncbi:carbohydrate ABC transporter permease [Kineococcus sp. SYSU DK001]|uniref:carbohydrate ABC transporter permease n=1 Tax=Kineococcus sp. SYSU DK001 TaxID=3383122 RepID=UPI003D7E5724
MSAPAPTPTTPPTTRPASPSRRGVRPRQVVVVLLLAVTVFACLMPFVWLVRSSLMGTEQIFSYPPDWIPDPFLWSNFSGALASAPFGRYAANTLLLVVLIVPGALLSSSAAAFAFSRLAWRGRDVCFAVLMSGLMLPYAATLIPTFVGWQELGLTNTYVPLALPPWFAAGAAFNIFMLRQFFLQIPADLDNAMYVDGGSPWTVFWRIAVPLTKGPLTLVAVFTTIAVWNDLLNPLIYLSDPDKFTLSLGLASFRSLYTSQWGYLMAASLLVILPIMLLFAVAQRAIMENLALSGVKG